MDPVQEQVFELVRKQVWHLPRLVLTLATTLTDELGLDSLDRLQLGVRLEYALDIEIPDPELGQWHTVADVLACVRRHLLPPGGLPCPKKAEGPGGGCPGCTGCG